MIETIFSHAPLAVTLCVLVPLVLSLVYIARGGKLFGITLLLVSLFSASPAYAQDDIPPGTTFECQMLVLQGGVYVTDIVSIPCAASLVAEYANDCNITRWGYCITEDSLHWNCATMGNRLCGRDMHFLHVPQVN